MRLTNYMIVTIVLASIALACMVFPLWALSFNAPVTGNEWNTITVYGTGSVSGPIDQINKANVYVGLEQLIPENIVALKLLPMVYVLAAIVIGLGGWRLSFKRVAALYLGLLLAIPLGIQFWLYLFGHDISPDATLVLDPFTPYVIGRYEVATFMIVSYLHVGYFLLVGTCVASLLVRRKWGSCP